VALRIAVLASGGGTNLQAILDKLHGGGDVEVVGVASDKPGATALSRAERAGVQTGTFPADDHADRTARDLAIADWLDELEVELVVLAGYMQLLAAEFIERFRGRIINVHPALLPSFPGLEAVQQAIDHGSKVTGVTVHFVDEGVDSGPIIFQRSVPIPDSRDWDELEDQIHATEHELLPAAISAIAAGRVSIDPGNPRLVVVAPE
jgi:phosphoribosylglycinamide formyltransferase-1